MTCMCGDTGCWSCGPAQGADPKAEAAMDWIADVFLADLTVPDERDPDAFRDWLTEELWNRMVNHDGLREAFMKWADPEPCRSCMVLESKLDDALIQLDRERRKGKP